MTDTLRELALPLSNFSAVAMASANQPRRLSSADGEDKGASTERLRGP